MEAAYAEGAAGEVEAWATVTHRGETELRPDLAAILDREAWASWRSLQALARVPGIRAPADSARWLEWANGGATTGPRYEGIVLQELCARWHERRTRPKPPPPPWLTLGPWHRQDRPWRSVWARCPIARKTPAVEIACYSGRWELVTWPAKGAWPTVRGEATACMAACDAALTAAGVALAETTTPIR